MLHLIEAPSNLGLRPPEPGRVPGVAGMPDALRAVGLHDRLAPAKVKRVTPPAYRPERDPVTGVRNLESVASYSRLLAEAVGESLDSGAFPLVLGGDCSILLGCMLACRRYQPTGLIFLDGHVDFLTPETSGSGGTAGMDLALVCGYGPDALTTFDGVKPLVDPAHAVMVGNRDQEKPDEYPTPEFFTSGVGHLSLSTVQVLGLEATVGAVWERLPQSLPVWLHLDSDVLDSDLFPPVDSPIPGGLTFAELTEFVGTLLRSGRVIGMDVTIYDPNLDPDRHYARLLADVLVGSYNHP